MEIISATIGLIIGIIIAYPIFYLFNKTKNVSRKELKELSSKYEETNIKLQLSEQTTQNLTEENNKLNTNISLKETEVTQLRIKATTSETNLNNSNTRINELQGQLKDALAKNNTQQNEINEHKTTIAQLNIDKKYINERLATQRTEIENIQRNAHVAFENIANRLLRKQSTEFTETNKINIEGILDPLKREIQAFKTRVETIHTEDISQQTSLTTTIRELLKQTNTISSEANNLATALKGNPQARGNWGEMILERILELSGLRKNEEYFIQESIINNEGRTQRPDVIAKLPDNRFIIIDSKVSLNAYNNFSTTKNSQDLEAHIQATRTHIDQLSAKKYDDHRFSLDYTMMFIPIEPAYLLAIENDTDLWYYAYNKRILLVSPTTLIACLKLFSDLWRREWQNENAMKIVKRGEQLYDKFLGFIENFRDIAVNIDRAKDSYTIALGQLSTGRGNLIHQATQLRNLGLNTNREIPGELLSNNPDDKKDETDDDKS